MIVKINVKTPKGQAAKAVETQKKTILGQRLKHNLLKQEVVKDDLFYWILDIKDADYVLVSNKAFKAEIMIKKFYSVLMKTISRVNKLVKKFKKGASWIRKALIKKLKKNMGPNAKDSPLFAEIETMPDTEFNDFIKMNDAEQMRKLLSGPLITIEEIEKDAAILK